MGGTPKRMETFAYYIMEIIGHKLPTGTTLLDISQYSYRYSMYKVGPVLSISVSNFFSVSPEKRQIIHLVQNVSFSAFSWFQIYLSRFTYRSL